VKLLRAALKPLAEEELPEAQDLGAFWSKVRRAIYSLDPSFNDFELKFTSQHIATFGPYLLGARGWQQMGGKQFANWERFVAEVEDIFGMTADQLEE
jgi:hypothetical protein